MAAPVLCLRVGHKLSFQSTGFLEISLSCTLLSDLTYVVRFPLGFQSFAVASFQPKLRPFSLWDILEF